MDVMTTATPARPQARRARLPAVPESAARARACVRSAVRDWHVRADEDTAVLLTCELVTNAIAAAPGRDIMLSVRCASGRLRVEVHDTAPSLPAPAAAPADAEAGRGLMLVGALSADWGFYRTPAGKAVYFTLPLQPDPPACTPPAARAGGSRAAQPEY